MNRLTEKNVLLSTILLACLAVFGDAAFAAPKDECPSRLALEGAYATLSEENRERADALALFAPGSWSIDLSALAAAWNFPEQEADAVAAFFVSKGFLSAAKRGDRNWFRIEAATSAFLLGKIADREGDRG